MTYNARHRLANAYAQIQATGVDDAQLLRPQPNSPPPPSSFTFSLSFPLLPLPLLLAVQSSTIGGRTLRCGLMGLFAFR